MPNTASLLPPARELQAWWRREIGQTRSQATFLSSLPEAWDYRVVDGFFFPMPSAFASFIAGSPAVSGVRSSLWWASKEGEDLPFRWHHLAGVQACGCRRERLLPSQDAHSADTHSLAAPEGQGPGPDELSEG